MPVVQSCVFNWGHWGVTKWIQFRSHLTLREAISQRETADIVQTGGSQTISAISLQFFLLQDWHAFIPHLVFSYTTPRNHGTPLMQVNSRGILPSIAVNPDALSLRLLGSIGGQVGSEGGRAFVERFSVPLKELLRVAALHWLGGPAPDVVQLEKNARLHLQQWKV